MSRFFRVVVLGAVLGLIACSGGYTAPYPTVQLLSYDPVTYTYEYEVRQDFDGVDGFGQFEVDAYTVQADPYSMSGPVSNINGNEAWWTTRTTWSPPDPYVAYVWYGGNVPPGFVLEQAYGVPWIGVFTLTVPNTQPVPGMVIVTMATDGYKHAVNEDVPGAVPEPSGLAALGTMLAGAAAKLRRRKR